MDNFFISDIRNLRNYIDSFISGTSLENIIISDNQIKNNIRNIFSLNGNDKKDAVTSRTAVLLKILQNREPSTEDFSIEEDECPICLLNNNSPDIIFKCKHAICLSCSIKLVEYKFNNCPMCNKDVKKEITNLCAKYIKIKIDD